MFKSVYLHCHAKFTKYMYPGSVRIADAIWNTGIPLLTPFVAVWPIGVASLIVEITPWNISKVYSMSSQHSNKFATFEYNGLLPLFVCTK